MSLLELIPADRAPLAPELEITQWFNTNTDLTLNSLRGRVVVLHAFQMLCPACVSHGIPQAKKIQAAFASNVQVVGVHTVFEHHMAMTPVSLEAFLHEYRVTFPVGVDTPRASSPVPKTMADYAMHGTPSLLLIDAHTRVRLHAFGQADDLKVGAAVATLVTEAEQKLSLEGSEKAPVEASCSPEGCSV